MQSDAVVMAGNIGIDQLKWLPAMLYCVGKGDEPALWHGNLAELLKRQGVVGLQNIKKMLSSEPENICDGFNLSHRVLSVETRGLYKELPLVVKVLEIMLINIWVDVCFLPKSKPALRHVFNVIGVYGSGDNVLI